MYRSSDFRPCFDRLHNLRAFVPSGTPFLALTATVTRTMRASTIRSLDMRGCEVISLSPNRPNIFYAVLQRTNVESDFHELILDLKKNSALTSRVIVYCRSLNMCATLYAHFLHCLGDQSYYPSDAEQISDNRLFGMFHSNTPDHNKQVISRSLAKSDGVVRVVFATMALGMGVDFVGLNTIIHYGAPRSLDDYFQESGRAGPSGDFATSTVYWCPIDAPLRKDSSKPHDVEVNLVRKYLENSGSVGVVNLLTTLTVHL